MTDAADAVSASAKYAIEAIKTIVRIDFFGTWPYNIGKMFCSNVSQLGTLGEQYMRKDVVVLVAAADEKAEHT